MGDIAEHVIDIVASLQEANDQIRERDERIRKLEEALVPFSALIDHVDRLAVQADNASIWAVSEAEITQGDVRRAFDAIWGDVKKAADKALGEG